MKSKRDAKFQGKVDEKRALMIAKSYAPIMGSSMASMHKAKSDTNQQRLVDKSLHDVNVTINKLASSGDRIKGGIITPIKQSELSDQEESKEIKVDQKTDKKVTEKQQIGKTFNPIVIYSKDEGDSIFPAGQPYQTSYSNKDKEMLMQVKSGESKKP